MSSLRPSLALLPLALFGACGGLGQPEETAGKADGSQRALRYPLVLVHGFNASPESRLSFSAEVVAKLRVALGADKVLEAQVNPYQSQTIRGGDLLEYLQREVLSRGVSKVHLVGHSQGGLDARWVAARAGGHLGVHHPFVASVTTVGTPHRGTSVAEAFIADSGWANRQAASVMCMLLNDDACRYPHDLRAALAGMSERGAERFNQAFLDNPSVPYLSWAAVSHIGSLPMPFSSDDEVCNVDADQRPLRDGSWDLPSGGRDAMSAVLAPLALVTGGPGDGVVTVESAKWGIFRGCLRADHLDLIGQSLVDSGRHVHGGFEASRFLLTDVVGDLLAIEAAERAGASVRDAIAARPAPRYR